MQLNSTQDLHQALIKSNDSQKIQSLIEQLSQTYIQADHKYQDILEYLAENNILALFYDKIINSSTNLAIFIISKISFIISNLKNSFNITYVLNNQVLNEFINHQYDFTNQEMVDYYVNFLKIIAIRIDRENIFLYYNQRYSSFPLLWQAQKFINYPDNLVNNTVKVIILSVSKLFNLNQDISLTQSIQKQENITISKFKNYLLKSPFIIAYQKYIHKITQILPNVTKQESYEQLEDYFMFFNDLLKQCPFLFSHFEQIVLHQLILPILDYSLLNKKTDIKIGFKLGFYLIQKVLHFYQLFSQYKLIFKQYHFFLSVHQILQKLPFKNILNYISQDMIPKESNYQQKYNYNQSVNWVYETQNYEKEFEQIYLENNNQENQFNIVEDQSQNDLIKNMYKSQMVLLLTPRNNSIVNQSNLLLLNLIQLKFILIEILIFTQIFEFNKYIKQLIESSSFNVKIKRIIDSIWQIMQSNSKPWPINQIIQLLQQPQDQIIYSKKAIDFIIFFFLNQDKNILKLIYQEYENKVRQLIINAQSEQSQLSQDLVINWEIIQNFDWNIFKKTSPTITFDDLQNLEYENELTQFKLMYIWLLLKCLVMNFKKQSQKIQYVPNKEISHLTDDIYIQIDEKRTYLIINSEQGYLIQTTACSNPNRGVVTFAYSLASLCYTQEKDYLKFECNKLAINQFKPSKIHITNNLMNEIIQKINDGKRELYNNIVDQLQQLMK